MKLPESVSAPWMTNITKCYLLVYRGEVAPHDDDVLGGIDLGVKVRPPDQVHDPSLRVLGLHGQLLREHADVNLLVYPTQWLGLGLEIGLGFVSQ